MNYITHGILKIKKKTQICLTVSLLKLPYLINLFQLFLNILHNHLHNHTRQAAHNSIQIHHMNTQSYRFNSVRNKSAFMWNRIINNSKGALTREQTSITHSRFWPLRRWGRLSESVKKGKFMMKIFF